MIQLGKVREGTSIDMSEREYFSRSQCRSHCSIKCCFVLFEGQMHQQPESNVSIASNKQSIVDQSQQQINLRFQTLDGKEEKTKTLTLRLS